jgi:hypothetical protein
MSVALRVLLTIFASIVILMMMTVGVAVAAIYSAGTVAVDVQPVDGSEISVHVPAGLIHVAIWLLPGELQAEAMHEVAAEVEPYWGAVRAAGDELSRLPDFVLVEVEGPREHVIVEKRNQRLIVHVDSDGERIEVSIPLRTVRSLLNKVEGWV